MSKHHECCNAAPMAPMMGPCGAGVSGTPFSSNILNLIIFVLIVLQFGTRRERRVGECGEEEGGGLFGEIDNSILFVIALFFLFVCSCGSCGGFPGCGRGGLGFGGYGY